MENMEVKDKVERAIEASQHNALRNVYVPSGARQYVETESTNAGTVVKLSKKQ